MLKFWYVFHILCIVHFAILLNFTNKCTIYVNNYVVLIGLLHVSMFARHTEGVSC